MELKAGYKQTEVGAIPEDWTLEYVEDLASITTGSRNTQDRVDDGQFPFFVRSQTVERINSYSFEGEAVLTAGDGVGTGKVFHYMNGKFDVHQRVYRISDFSDRINGYYFYLYFSFHFYSRIMQMTAKSSVDSVRREMIARMLVPLPPTRAEQEAIADAVRDANSLVESLEQLLVKKRQIKQGVMQELLTGRKRLPGFKGKWAVTQLGDVVDTDPENIGRDTRSAFAFNYIALDDIDVGTLTGYSEEVLETAPSRARRRLRKNDVLVSTVRPNLMSHLLFALEGDNWVCSTGFCVVRCRKGVTYHGYIYAQLFTSTVARQIEALLTGSNYPAISSSDVRALQIPLPEYEEQTAIATILTDMDAEIATLEVRLAKARQIKQGMMQELLTGRTRLV